MFFFNQYTSASRRLLVIGLLVGCGMGFALTRACGQGVVVVQDPTWVPGNALPAPSALSSEEFRRATAEPEHTLQGPALQGPALQRENGELPGDIFRDYRIPSELPKESLRTIDGAELGSPAVEYQGIAKRKRYEVYRQRESTLGYMPGDGQQFGWLDFDNTPYLGEHESGGLAASIGLHLLSGPEQAPLPARLWDFAIGYQNRSTLSEIFSYDVASNIGVYSDFEDSARDGVRILGHAVGMLHASDNLDWVFGIDYLDRDDYRMLPVIGYSWRDAQNPTWMVDMVFPRPKVQVALQDCQALYVAGLLGGGTWDIEMPYEVNDVMTYRDFRLLVGLENLLPSKARSSVELGWVFGRKLTFRDRLGAVDFGDAFLVQWVTRH
jgi:hypothetical protein